jgi:hypothetical protein
MSLASVQAESAALSPAVPDGAVAVPPAVQAAVSMGLPGAQRNTCPLPPDNHVGASAPLLATQAAVLVGKASLGASHWPMAASDTSRGDAAQPPLALPSGSPVGDMPGGEHGSVSFGGGDCSCRATGG